MTQGGFYEGLNFHWNLKTMTYKIGEKTIVNQVMLPTKFNGASVVVSAPATTKVDDLDVVVIELSAGRTDRELKQAVIRDERFKGKDAYLKELINGPRLANLEKEGKLTKGPDGKFI